MLAAICTGVLAGLGYALIYLRSSSTGGTDFIIMAAKEKWPHATLGKITFITDVTVVLLGGLLMGDVDGVIYGRRIVEPHHRHCGGSGDVQRRGCGTWPWWSPGKGSRRPTPLRPAAAGAPLCFRGREDSREKRRKWVMCACNNKQMHLVRQAAKGVDPGAFIIILGIQ